MKTTHFLVAFLMLHVLKRLKALFGKTMIGIEFENQRISLTDVLKQLHVMLLHLGELSVAEGTKDETASIEKVRSSSRAFYDWVRPYGETKRAEIENALTHRIAEVNEWISTMDLDQFAPIQKVQASKCLKPGKRRSKK